MRAAAAAQDAGSGWGRWDLPRFLSEGLLCLQPCHGLHQGKIGVGSPVYYWVRLSEPAQPEYKMLNAAHAAHLPLINPPTQVWWELVFNMEHSLLSLADLFNTAAYRMPTGYQGQLIWHRQNLLWRVVGPRELLGRPKALVPQCHYRVDDVLAVTTHHNKPTS